MEPELTGRETCLPRLGIRHPPPAIRAADDHAHRSALVEPVVQPVFLRPAQIRYDEGVFPLRNRVDPLVLDPQGSLRPGVPTVSDSPTEWIVGLLCVYRLVQLFVDSLY